MRFQITILLMMLLLVSLLLSLLSYSVNQLGEFNVFEGLASFVFWISIVSLIFLFPLRSIAPLFLKYVRTRLGAIVFGSYITVHLVLYGLLLEGIVTFSFGLPSVVSQFYVSVASISLYPVTLSSLLVGFAFNPSIDLLIPPVFVIALSFYTICISFLIGTLVLTNVMKVREIGKMCGTAIKSRNFVVLPILGVIGGAACCLSLPVLISLAAPTAAILSNTPVIWYSAYFVFPAATAVGLKYNMDSTMRLASKISNAVAPKNAPIDSRIVRAVVHSSSPSSSRPARLIQSKKAIAIVISAVIVLASVLVVVAVLQPSVIGSPGVGSKNTVTFTIIESDRGSMEGMNGSAYHFTVAWPVITVHQGDTVIIHLLSVNSSEPHGFTISHYFDPGVGLLPGGTYTVKFVANELGTFVITCLLFCAIHPLMDHGEFIVDS
jgi:hypothetical protein